MKNIKFYIGISIAILVVGLLFLFSFTIFAVRYVEIDYKTNKVNITKSDDEIIASADFHIGGSVFFHGKSQYIENIEQADPYIEVINIETVFPSKFIVHIKERLEVYCFKSQYGYFVCDEKLKVLKVEASYDSTQNNAMLISGDVVKERCEVGQTLQVENFADIYTSLYENNKTLAVQQTIIKQIEFQVTKDENTSKDILVANITTFDDLHFQICNCGYGLSAKTKLFMNVFSWVFDQIGKEINLRDSSKVVLTEQLLHESTIIINNYYDISSHSENDCYFDIVPNS